MLSGKHQIYQSSTKDFSHFFTNNLKNADAFLIPHDISTWSKDYYSYVENMSNEKPVLYFNRSDRPIRKVIKNGYSLQTTYVGKTSVRAIIIPYNVQSLESLPYRSLSDSPVLSFAGYVPKLTVGRIIRSSLEQPLHPLRANGALIRMLGLKRLRSLPLDTNLKVRSHYGGAKSLISDPVQFRSEFELSVFHSDIVFSPRGDANGSQRFYETISAGRIPIVPDSGIKLPVIPNFRPTTHINVHWTSYNMEREIIGFWNELNVSKYRKIQRNLRTLFSRTYNYNSYLEMIFSSKEASDLSNFCV
jgi:hypothetical protein